MLDLKSKAVTLCPLMLVASEIGGLLKEGLLKEGFAEIIDCLDLQGRAIMLCSDAM